MKKESFHNMFLGFFIVLVLSLGFFYLFLKISAKENPDKVSFINGKYQVFNCKQHAINKIINLDVRVSEYSLLGFSEINYYPFGGEVCLK